MALSFSSTINVSLFRLLHFLPIPILIYIMGQFLEGPPYRVIVHQDPFFILACFAPCFFAALFLRRTYQLPLPLFILQTVLIPGCFIYYIQHYFNGATDPDFGTETLFFALLMGLNGVIYGWSLFKIKYNRNKPT